MRTNLENSLLYQPKIFAAKHNHVALTLIGTYQIPANGPSVYFLNGGSSTRIILLPAISSDAGQSILIANTGSTNILDVSDSGGIHIVNLNPGAMGLFASFRTGWASMVSDTTSAVVNQRQVTSSPITVAADDDVINCKITSGSPTCALPTSASRLGRSVVFKDIAGNFAAHNLTVTPNGAERIDGLTSVVLATNYQELRLRPANDGVNSGWAIDQ